MALGLTNGFAEYMSQIYETIIWPNICHKYVTQIYITQYMVKFSRYRPGVAERVGTGIALLFHDRGTRRG